LLFTFFYPPLMQCVVTAGPTFEPLDAVRRLTNFSTGRLGSRLAEFLTARGHDTTLLIGEQARLSAPDGERPLLQVQPFTTTTDLRDRLRALAARSVDAVFHAAAVSDFAFGKICQRSPDAEWVEVKRGKIPSRAGALLAELLPTPKILPELRQWFPRARLIGWKYEVEGDRAEVIRLARQQIAECQTDACVANGPAYGAGFGLVPAAHPFTPLPDAAALCEALEQFIRQ
jgi:phosphopantothenoylcysteine decarboxylase/phosphopantothenate--cysteine ligase